MTIEICSYEYGSASIGSGNPSNNGSGTTGSGNAGSGKISSAARTLFSQHVGGALAKVLDDIEIPETPEEWDHFNSLMGELLDGCPNDHHFINDLLAHIQTYIAGGGTDLSGAITDYLYDETAGNDGAKLECISRLLRDKKCDALGVNFLMSNNLNISLAELKSITGDFSESCSSQESFNSMASLKVEEYIQECLGEFYSLVIALEVTELGDRFKYCGNAEDVLVENIPECEGCSVQEKGVVTIDKKIAREMMKCATDKLWDYDGTQVDVKNALEQHFGGASGGFVARYVRIALKHTNRFNYFTSFQAQNNGDGNCGPTTLAWVIPVLQGATDVRLCRPNYWNAPDLERRGTLIHEWNHQYWFSGDVAYDWHQDYAELSTIQQLVNADAYSEFVKQLCGE